MSRNYEVELTIKGVTGEDIQNVPDAVESLTERHIDGGIVCGEMDETFRVTLFGSDDEESFARQLMAAVTDAIGRPVDIRVAVTYLDELPYEAYTTGPNMRDAGEGAYIELDTPA